METMDFMF